LGFIPHRSDQVAKVLNMLISDAKGRGQIEDVGELFAEEIIIGQ
jgi:hypothetical protein